MLGRIAVHLDRDSACARRVRAAAQLAARHDADLVGVYAGFLQPRYFQRSVAAIPGGIDAMLHQRLTDAMADVEDMFRSIAGSVGVTSYWRAPAGAPEDVLGQQSRYCDLLVMSQPDDEEPGPVRMPELTASVLVEAGRPVLMLPFAGELPAIGRRVLFGWDRSRESARALADAGHLLEQAEELVVLEIDPPTESPQAARNNRDDMLAYCSSHGYPLPKDITRDSSGIGVGNAILNAAADHGSDLIVMGAYGHSRLRESLFGGASRTLLASMTAPVLFSH